MSFESLKFLFKCLKTNRPELTADFHMSSPPTAELETLLCRLVTAPTADNTCLLSSQVAYTQMLNAYISFLTIYPYVGYTIINLYKNYYTTKTLSVS